MINILRVTHILQLISGFFRITFRKTSETAAKFEKYAVITKVTCCMHHSK